MFLRNSAILGIIFASALLVTPTTSAEGEVNLRCEVGDINDLIDCAEQRTGCTFEQPLFQNTLDCIEILVLLAVELALGLVDTVTCLLFGINCPDS